MGLSLTGRKRKDTYPWLLQMQGAGSTLHASVPIVVCFGDGTETPLSLTTTGLFIGGSAALLASQLGTVEGKIPVLGAGDKLAASMIPAINVIDSLSVANAAARLALSSAAALNTVVLDADTGKTWALVSGGDPATSGDWLQIGDRAITTSDVSGLEDALDLKADLDSPELTTPNLIGGNISGNITIEADGAYNLGDSAHYLAAAYINTLYSGSMTVGYSSSGSGAGSINLYSDALGSHTQIQSLATTGRLAQFPDQDGIVALRSDILVRTAQIVVTELTADFSTAAAIPFDATIPQSGEGAEYITAAITPTNASSVLEIEVDLAIGGSAGGIFIAALFKDSDANAIQTWGSAVGGSGIYPFRMVCRVSAGSTSARTYKIRVGSNGITAYINRNSATADLFGATVVSRLAIREIAPNL
jgi:hypothetical protein